MPAAMTDGSLNQPDRSNCKRSIAQPEQELSTKPDAVKYRYQAFLSYAHEDKPTVAWLHKLLTAFWVPGKRRRLIFMDQESLPADGGLSNRLQNALSESRYLIVCCSKSSAESYWVNTEVSEFLKSHTPDNVLACMVGPRGNGLFEAPLAVQNIEKQLDDELLKPDLRGYPEKLKGGELKASVKEALSLLVPLVDLPSKDSLLDRRRKSMIIGSLLTLFLALAAIGWKLWDNRPQSQVDKILAKGPGVVKAAAAGDNPASSDLISAWLSASVLVGGSKEALDAAREIKDANSRFQALVGVAWALAKAGKTEEAIDTARKIEDADSRYRALAGVAGTLAKAGRAEEALDAARKIEDADFRARTLVKIVEVLANRHETVNKAKNVIEAAQQAAEQISEEYARSAALANVATGLAKLHLYRQARELVDLNNTSAKDKLTAYAAILREYYIELHPNQAKLFHEEQKEDH
jgi:tetratricopeptide (TPR) repeat protein